MTSPEGSLVDRPGPVREGEGLDLPRLRRWLEREAPELAGPLTVEQFRQGYSNLTYLLRAGDREVVLRRPPEGSEVATAHDMGREHHILSRLPAVYPLAPRALAYCEDPGVLGAPFYLMERVSGLVLRADPPPEAPLDRDTAERLSTALVDALADLHGVDYRAAGLADLGRPEGYVRRQVEGWIRRYEASRTSEAPGLGALEGWLREHSGEGAPPALVHNDFKFDNLVLDAQDLTLPRAVLDWEMATIGDPFLDLGTTLGYWVEAGDPEPLRRLRQGPTDLPGMLTRRQVVERYEERTGRTLPDPAFCYAFGLYKIAVIAQQIYFRYARGLTRDPRFASLPTAISCLSGMAERVATGNFF